MERKHIPWTKERIDPLKAKFKKYIYGTDIPIIKEFAYLNDISRPTLYDIANKDEDFAEIMQICIDKKEAQLERKGLNNEINTTMAVFSLKQLGWTDKHETAITGNINNPFEGLTEDELRKIINR